MANECMRKDCGKPARWQVGFRIWLMGAERTPEHAQPALTTLAVCDDCKPVVKPDDFFPVETQVATAHQFGAAGSPAPPDFANVELTFTELVRGTPVDFREMTQDQSSIEGPKGRLN